MNPRFPWWSPQLGRLEHTLVAEVLESRFLNDGEMTTRFEQGLADALEAKHVIAVSNGTSAIFLALASVGIGPGDEVLVPDLTFIATANAVTLAGATPVLVDVDPAALTLDPEAAARAITSRTKAIVPVHVSGRSADLGALRRLADARGLVIIEDAAESLGSRRGGRCLGTHGRLGCLSFSPQKTITTGQGGAVLTDDDALAVRLRELKDQGRSVRGTGGDDAHPRLGYNFKLTNLQAAVGVAQLQSLPQRLSRLQQIARAYAAGLRGVAGISLFGFRLEEGESPQWVDAWCEERDALLAALASQGAECRRFWFPLHTQAPYRQPDGRFPQSARMAPRSFWLPSALTMSDADVAIVCGWIRDWLAQRRAEGRVSLSAAGR